MTIKQAKQIAVEMNGRLPRPGREVCVESGVRQETLTNAWDGRKVSGRFKYSVYLRNSGGRFQVWEWMSSTPEWN